MTLSMSAKLTTLTNENVNSSPCGFAATVLMTYSLSFHSL